jgi:hypothetical protein
MSPSVDTTEPVNSRSRASGFAMSDTVAIPCAPPKPIIALPILVVCPGTPISTSL